MSLLISQITGATFTLDGRRLVTVSEDATVLFISYEFDCFQSLFVYLMFDFLFFSFYIYQLRVWNPKTSQSEVIVSGPHLFHKEGITRLALHPENPNLVNIHVLFHTKITFSFSFSILKSVLYTV
jgi:hypothetical protein